MNGDWERTPEEGEGIRRGKVGNQESEGTNEVEGGCEKA